LSMLMDNALQRISTLAIEREAGTLDAERFSKRVLELLYEYHGSLRKIQERLASPTGDEESK